MFEILFAHACVFLLAQCPDVESPDVILIKDEDDVGGCEPVVGEFALFNNVRPVTFIGRHIRAIIGKTSEQT